MTYTTSGNKINIESSYHTATILIQDNGMTADEQAQAFIDEHSLTIEQLKARKSEEIKSEVEYLRANNIITSSVGFDVNARREDILNIDELISLGVTSFRGADNVMHTVTSQELQIIRGEIVNAGLSLYNRKWAAEDAIKNATTEAEIASISL